jgi:hypothetical protein
MYAIHLGNKHKEELGFIPDSRIHEYERQNQILYEQEFGEMCGFLIHGKLKPVTKIVQICVQHDARRWYHATNLFAQLLARAWSRNSHTIKWRCAAELDANQFWTAIGARLVEIDCSPNTRGRSINVWDFAVPNPFFPETQTWPPQESVYSHLPPSR